MRLNKIRSLATIGRALQSSEASNVIILQSEESSYTERNHVSSFLKLDFSMEEENSKDREKRDGVY